MAIKLIIDPPEKARITGSIVFSPTPGWWVVQDSQSRMYKCASGKLYRKGERVAVVGNQIIGHAGSTDTPAVHQV